MQHPVEPSGDGRRGTHSMRVAGMFSGIGGIEIGFDHAGFKSSMLVEIDPVAQGILRNRFANTELRPDITGVERLPPGTQVVVGGFPCQDLSAMGGKLGLDGARSGLVSHVFRLLTASPDV